MVFSRLTSQSILSGKKHDVNKDCSCTCSDRQLTLTHQDFCPEPLDRLPIASTVTEELYSVCLSVKKNSINGFNVSIQETRKNMSQYQPPQPPYSQQGFGQAQTQNEPQWQQQSPMQPYPPQYQPPMSPPKKKSHKGLFIVLGVILAVALIACVGIAALLAAGGNAVQHAVNQASTQVAQQTTQVSQPTSQPTAAAHAIGQPVQVGDWLVTINSVKTSKGSDLSIPKSGNTYLIVDVTVKNTSSTNQDVSSLIQFNLKDSTGLAYTETITDFTRSPDGAVTPGSLLRGQIVFEVPLSEHTFTFSFQSDLTGSDITEWHISI